MLGKRAPDGFGLEELLQQRIGKRTDQRAPQMPQATQDDHHQHGAGEMPTHHLGVDEPVHHAEQESRQAGNGARDRERRQLVGIGREAGRLHALLVDADAGQGAAEARPQQDRQEEEHGHQATQCEAIHHQRLLQFQQAGDAGLHRQVDAVGATAQGGVVHNEIGHLRERQRHHDEVHALGAQRQRTDGQCVDRRSRNRCRQKPQQ